MTGFREVLEKLAKVEELLADIKAHLDAMEHSDDLSVPLKAPKPPAKELPPDDNLCEEFVRLYQVYATDNQAVVMFVEGKTKHYLAAFCRANSLPIDVSKSSKRVIAEKIQQWMAQRKAITQPIR